jgi:hypothetical protein
MLAKQAIGGTPTIIVKRPVFEKVGVFDPLLKRGNDGDMWRRISKHYEVLCSNAVVAKVHTGHERISVNNSKNLVKAAESFEIRLNKFADDFENHSTAKKEVLLKILNCYCQALRFDRVIATLPLVFPVVSWSELPRIGFVMLKEAGRGVMNRLVEKRG